MWFVRWLLNHKWSIFSANNSSPQCLFATPLQEVMAIQQPQFHRQQKAKEEKLLAYATVICGLKMQENKLSTHSLNTVPANSRITCVELLFSVVHEFSYKLWTNNPEAFIFSTYCLTAYDIFSPKMFAIKAHWPKWRIHTFVWFILRFAYHHIVTACRR